jgi:hypothetical protein
MDLYSKGVQYYAYLGDSQFDVVVQKPANGRTQTSSISLSAPGVMSMGGLQISNSDIRLTDHTGRFEWTAHQNSTDKLLHRFAEISPFTGNVGKSTMGAMLHTPSVVEPGYALSYGFYDAGSGAGGLTNQHQSYVYVTRNHSRWMGDLVGSTPGIAQKPFGTLVLPGAHDCGMFDQTTVHRLVWDPLVFATVTGALPLGLGPLTPPMAQRGIINMSFSQKDDITTMLNLGVRYLDFRPGYCYKKVAPGIFHQHWMIPGYPFDGFLKDVFTWLVNNPTEIVVVSLGFAGFKNDEMKPSVNELQQAITDAQQQSGGGIVTGNRYDLSKPLSTLLQLNRRLIFLNEIAGLDAAAKYDSYKEKAYFTAKVDPILKRLESMTAAGQAGHDYTVLQLQGTATGLGRTEQIGAAVTMSNASSPLLSTKAAFDHATYPWVKNNVANTLLPTQLLVLLNDFADNALTEYAIALSKKRAGF